MYHINKNSNTSYFRELDDSKLPKMEIVLHIESQQNQLYGEKEIKLIMQQANVFREETVNALNDNNGDVVNAIMQLTM